MTDPSSDPEPDARREAQRERELVLAEFADWRLAADPDAPAAVEMVTLETLLRLKAEQQGSADPGLWTAELIEELLTEVVPRTVVQAREQAMDMVPALGRLFSFLQESGRWDPRSLAPSSSQSVLDELEFAVIEAADDPTRRSFSTNILGHGLRLGVDLEDDEELGAYMHWYSTLPDEERLELSETGRLPTPSTPFDADRERRRMHESRREDSPWPWFLPSMDEEGRSPLTDLAEERDPQAYLDNDLVRRAARILETVGESRRATASGALGREDTATLLTQLGLAGPARSLWDRPELAGPWVALLDGGWLELSAGRVHRRTGPVPYVAADQDPEGFVEFGHAVLTACLMGHDARVPEDGGFRGMPDTLAALLVACGPDGLRLPPGPDLQPDPLTGTQDGPQHERMLGVLQDLEDLTGAGLLRRRDGVFRGTSAVTVALVALIRAHEADDEGTRPEDPDAP